MRPKDTLKATSSRPARPKLGGLSNLPSGERSDEEGLARRLLIVALDESSEMKEPSGSPEGAWASAVTQADPREIPAPPDRPWEAGAPKALLCRAHVPAPVDKQDADKSPGTGGTGPRKLTPLKGEIAKPLAETVRFRGDAEI